MKNHDYKLFYFKKVCLLAFIILFVAVTFDPVVALSVQKNSNEKGSDTSLSRRDLLSTTISTSAAVVGAVAYGKLLSDTIRRVARGIAYPPDYEERAVNIISQSLVEAAATTKDEKIRILEVGVGKDCRVARRGLYNNGLQQIFATSNGSKLTGIELTGVDLELPSPDIENEAQNILRNAIPSGMSSTLDFHTIHGDITRSLGFSAGYFDSVICCLSLCSVTDQQKALQEIKRLIRPDGGTFGYVEHVAVDLSKEPYHFLDWQQRKLDPLQQKLAGNCHLHRNTEEVIAQVFAIDSNDMSTTKLSSMQLQHERFLVDDMWPVNCQVCGVIKKYDV